ncbi:MAG: glycosyl hydrolase [Candidatus Paceibacterota bacterium]
MEDKRINHMLLVPSKKQISFVGFAGIALLCLFVIYIAGDSWKRLYFASPQNTISFDRSDAGNRVTHPEPYRYHKIVWLQNNPFACVSQKKDMLIWGVQTGWQENIAAFEREVGRPDILAVFIHFGNENSFPSTVIPKTKDRQTLAIFWEATDYNVSNIDQPRFSYDAILRGDWDPYMRSFAADAKSYGGPVILIPFSEMNGDWYPWSGTKNGNTPEKAVLAFRHVHDIFSDVPNVKIGWAVNHSSHPPTQENAIERYYPGDPYVDYVGVDGFNFGGADYGSFDGIFGNALATLSKYNKPIYIFSLAAAEGPEKSAWISDAFLMQIPKYPNIVGWIWFNENKERDWRVNSDPASLESFKAILPNCR